MRFAAICIASLALSLTTSAQGVRQEPIKKGVNEVVIPEGKY